jgi:hypothetical protein
MTASVELSGLPRQHAGGSPLERRVGRHYFKWPWSLQGLLALRPYQALFL